MSNTKGKHLFQYDSVRELLDTPMYVVNLSPNHSVRVIMSLHYIAQDHLIWK
jgi:hypothetical protein